MSIQVMDWVWKHSSHGETALILMLAIADHCNEDGGGAYPSITALADKARVHPRTVKRQLQVLEDSGELVVDRNAGPKGVNFYRITFQRGGDKLSPPSFRAATGEAAGSDKLSPPLYGAAWEGPGSDDASPLVDGGVHEAPEGDIEYKGDPGCHGDVGVTGGVTPVVRGGDIAMSKRGDITMSHGTVINRQEPSGNRQGDDARARDAPPVFEHEFCQILSTIPGWAKHGQPESHVLEWLNKHGIGLDYALQTATALKAKWGAKGSRYQDPWAAFQNWVKRPPLDSPAAPRPPGKPAEPLSPEDAAVIEQYRREDPERLERLGLPAALREHQNLEKYRRSAAEHTARVAQGPPA